MAASDVFPQNATITVSGRTYEVRPLTPGDFAKAERHIKDRRIDGFLNSTRNVPLSDAVRAQTLANIECTPVDLAKDVLTSVEGQLFLVWLSVRVEIRTPFDKFRDMLKGEDLTNLTEIVLRITGLLSQTEDGDDPLGRPASTTTSREKAGASIGD